MGIKQYVASTVEIRQLSNPEQAAGTSVWTYPMNCPAVIAIVSRQHYQPMRYVFANFITLESIISNS